MTVVATPPAPKLELPPLKLGPITVHTPVILAPMAGITNAAYRRLCREQGAGLYVCEMITTRALVERIVSLVTTGTAGLDALAAITFTEKAAAELRDRVRRRLDTERERGLEAVTGRALVQGQRRECVERTRRQVVRVEHAALEPAASGRELWGSVVGVPVRSAYRYAARPAVFSPDGRKISFVSGRLGHPGLLDERGAVDVATDAVTIEATSYRAFAKAEKQALGAGAERLGAFAWRRRRIRCDPQQVLRARHPLLRLA